jgi:tellurite methyltransferase
VARAPADAPPADWLAGQRDLLRSQPRGRALDVACGYGRHAFLLADLGFAVDAVDVAEEAVDAVRERAEAAGAAVTALRADLEADPLPHPPYQVIVNVDYLQRSLFGPLEEALAPSGVLVFETFTEEHPTMNPAYTLRRGELRRAFPRLEVLRAREGGGRAGIVARRR